MSDVAGDEAPRRGRPRSEASHRAVLVAAARLLEEVPFEDITVEGIAAAAGVGKQTIYRWWDNKAAVILEALLAGDIDSNLAPVPDTGDLRADLSAWMDEVLRVSFTENSRTIARSLLSAMLQAGDSARMLLTAYRVWDEDSLLTERLRRDLAAGRVRPGIDPRAVVAALIDPVILRVIADGDPDEEWGHAIVQIVLEGIEPRS